MAYENYKLREKRWSVDDYLMEGFENNEKTELSGTSKRLSKGNKDPFTDSYQNPTLMRRRIQLLNEQQWLAQRASSVPF